MSTEPPRKPGAIARDELGRPVATSPVLTRGGGEWHPSKNQVAALEYVLGKNCDFTITGMAKAIGMRPKNWYYWKKSPSFVSWWRERMEEFMHDQLPVLMAGLLKLAKGKKKGAATQIAAVKLILDRYDEQFIPKSQQNINVKGELKLGVGNAKLEAIFDEVASRFPKQRSLAQDPAGEPGGEETPADGESG